MHYSMDSLLLEFISIIICISFFAGAIYLSWLIFRKRLIENKIFFHFFIDTILNWKIAIRKENGGVIEEIKVIFLEILFRLFSLLLIFLSIAAALMVIYFINKIYN
jgi:hypothetical protein